MRQKLPESAGYPLMAGPPVGKIIHPGEEFEADRLVPGCVNLDEDKSPPDDDKPAAKSRSSAKESGS